MKYKIYIQHLSVLLTFVLSSVFAYAQLAVKASDSTKLSVNEVPGDTYAWELYDVITGVDFAITKGNCPKAKAYFINNKSTGSTVHIKWLVEGEYFYKVTANNSCTDNIKIGRVTVGKDDRIPAPKVTIGYNCLKGTADLVASDYTGSLLWSTGETTESIEVPEGRTYTVVQIINGLKSPETVIPIPIIKAGMPTNVRAIPPKIKEGGTAELVAEGCDKGTLRWFTDSKLTQEVEGTMVSPKKTNVYYVVCESEAGCRSAAVPMTVEVIDPNRCRELYKNMRIEQLITSNNDGKNDRWDLNEVLEYCKQCGKSVKVTLYNSGGQKVYEKEGYMLDGERFEGYSKNPLDFQNNKKLPSDTYFYIISTEGEEERTGFINLITDE